jgi:hypothetical protein
MYVICLHVCMYVHVCSCPGRYNGYQLKLHFGWIVTTFPPISLWGDFSSCLITIWTSHVVCLNECWVLSPSLVSYSTVVWWKPYLLTCLLTCLLAYLLTCLLAYLLTFLLTYVLTYLLTCWLWYFTVVGKTIKLPQLDSPSKEEVDKYHAIFLKVLRQHTCYSKLHSFHYTLSIVCYCFRHIHVYIHL